MIAISGYFSPAGLTMIDSEDMYLWYDQLGETGTKVVITVSFNDSNPVCTNVAVGRRKRATVSFNQELLISIFNNPAV